MAEFETPFDIIFEAVAWLKLFYSKAENRRSEIVEAAITRNTLQEVSNQITKGLMLTQVEPVALRRIAEAYQTDGKVNLSFIDPEKDNNNLNNEPINKMIERFDGKKVTKGELEDFFVNDEYGAFFLNQFLVEFKKEQNVEQRKNLFDEIFGNKNEALEKLNDSERELFKSGCKNNGIKSDYIYKILQDPRNMTNLAYKELLSPRYLGFAVLGEAEKFEKYQIKEAYKRTPQYKRGETVTISLFTGEVLELNVDKVRDIESNIYVDDIEYTIYNAHQKEMDEAMENANGEPALFDSQQIIKEAENEEKGKSIENENDNIEKTDSLKTEELDIQDNHIEDTPVSAPYEKNYIDNFRETLESEELNGKEKEITVEEFKEATETLIEKYKNVNNDNDRQILAIAGAAYFMKNQQLGDILDIEAKKELAMMIPENLPLAFAAEMQLSKIPGYVESLQGKNVNWKQFGEYVYNNKAIQNDKELLKEVDLATTMSICSEYAKNIEIAGNNPEKIKEADTRLVNDLVEYKYGNINSIDENKKEELLSLVNEACSDIKEDTIEMLSEKMNDASNIIEKNNKEIITTDIENATDVEGASKCISSLEEQNSKLYFEIDNLYLKLENETKAIEQTVDRIGNIIQNEVDNIISINNDVNQYAERTIDNDNQNPSGQVSIMTTGED